jgi:hypothetical protein
MFDGSVPTARVKCAIALVLGVAPWQLWGPGAMALPHMQAGGMIRLRQLRLDRGMSVADLASASGVSWRAIRRLEAHGRGGARGDADDARQSSSTFRRRRC